MNFRTAFLLTSLHVGLLTAAAPSEAQSLAAGDSHTVVVKPDGTVWTWGGNIYGQLGAEKNWSSRQNRAAARLTLRMWSACAWESMG